MQITSANIVRRDTQKKENAYVEIVLETPKVIALFQTTWITMEDARLLCDSLQDDIRKLHLY